MFCSKCGKQIADGETYCAHCGTPVTKKDAFEPYGQSTYDNSAQAQQSYQAQPQQPYQQAQQPYQQQFQQPYGQPMYQPQYQQTYNQQTYQAYQQPFNSSFQSEKDISSARTLGILSIILGILVSSLAGWICGGIGLSKANNYLFSNDFQIRNSAQEAKKLNKIGLILTSVLFALRIIFIIIYFVAIIGIIGMEGYNYF